jgi:uncharacterized membrane protein YqjE
MSIGETGSSTGTTSRRLGAAVLGLLHSHVELFGIELQEQKARTVSLLLFALLLLVGLSTLVMILVWDTGYRLTGIICLCVFYSLAAAFCGVRLKAAVFDESTPFHATLEELANDRERLLP